MKSLLTLILLCGFVLQAWSQARFEISYVDGGVTTTPCSPLGPVSINFNNVPVLLEKTIKVKIKAVTTQITVNNIVWTSAPGFTITPSVPTVFPVGINSATGIEYDVKYAPADGASIGGSDIATLDINSSADPVDNATCFNDFVSGGDLDIRIRFLGTPTKDVINYSLVLDKSGSMGELFGTNVSGVAERKMDKLRKAVVYLTDLINLRPANPGQGFLGDNISIVKYASTAEPTMGAYLANTVVTTAVVSNIQNTLLSNTATQLGGQMYPYGSTNMADGVVKGLAQFPATGKNVMIVFTDGIENVHPLTSEDPPRTLISSANVDIYTIGMGDDVYAASLQNLSIASGFAIPRYFFLPEDFNLSSSSVTSTADPRFGMGSIYPLSSIYKKIYAEANGFQIASDPEKNVCLCSGSQQLFNTWITTSDKQAIFSIFHADGGQKELYTLELLDAKDNAVSAASPTGGMKVQEVKQQEYTIYKIDFDGADPSFYAGEWKVALKIKSPSAQTVPLGFGAVTFSNLTMAAQGVAQASSPGSPILLTIDLMELGKPVIVKDIIVTVLTPSGKQFKVTPVKNSFGAYTLSFTDTYETGTYTLYTQASVYNARKELSNRESTVYIPLTNAKPPVIAEEICMSCEYKKWSMRVIVILIVIVLLVVIIKRR